MVEVLEGRILSKYLLEKYSKDPQGWSFTIFPGTKEGSNGFFGALVGSKDEAWRLQLDSVYKPNPIMLGAKADIDPSIIPKFGNISYGYRKLDESSLIRILKVLNSEDLPSSLGRKKDSINKEDRAIPSRLEGVRILEGILGSLQPVVPSPGKGYAEGPLVVTSRQNLHAITDGQRELEDKLSSELRRLLKNKYSAYG